MAMSEALKEIYQRGFNAISQAPTETGREAVVGLINELVLKQKEIESVAKTTTLG